MNDPVIGMLASAPSHQPWDPSLQSYLSWVVQTTQSILGDLTAQGDRANAAAQQANNATQNINEYNNGLQTSSDRAYFL